MKHNQKSYILQCFKAGMTLNCLKAFKLTGTMNIRNRVGEFEKLGYVFKRESVAFKTRFKTDGHYTDYTLDLKLTPKKLLV